MDLPAVEENLENTRIGLLSLGVQDSEILVIKDADFRTFSALFRDKIQARIVVNYD